jgi:RNA polymerase sigma-70 factor, ECF subfamily
MLESPREPAEMTQRSPTFRDNEVLAVVPRRETTPLDFRQVYDSHFGFVWRAVSNRGVPQAALDDVVQEVFLVVHRKLSEFEGRSSVRTWLAAIVRRVVADHVKKRGNRALGQEIPNDLAAGGEAEPGIQAERRAAVALLEELIATMSEAQREVFILYELEQLTTREIGELTNVNENTVQTRLKAARKIFQQGVARHQAANARTDREHNGTRS